MIYTGDIGFYDKDGYIYILGRKKNVIIVTGLNVYPEQIEVLLENCQYISEASVYAENKLQKDEFICADIVFKSAETDLKLIYKYINENIESFKRPRKISIVSRIEKVSTGKKKRASQQS